MHQVLEKIKMKSFEGMSDIHGTLREVTFCEANDHEPSVLVIKGLVIEDALHVLDRLHGGLLKGSDAENPKVAKKDDPEYAPKSQAALAVNGKPKLEAVPKQVELAKPELKPAAAVAEASASVDIDPEALSKMEKLRDVIEHFVKAGYKTVTDIAKVSADWKDKVPALVQVEARGNFDKRMERAALVVLGGETAAS